ncbi:MAG: universal stress protein [Methanolinea sp.]|jgi:nucleotide-binding universal stress UspA family protein|nr:universal stress protein [Methanolinea sp.]
MTNKILVAVDGSPLTRNVIRAAVEEARCHGAELHIVHVIENGWAEGDVARELAIRDLEEEAASLLSSMKAEAEAQGGEATPHLLRGHPGDRIVDCAIDIGADMVILGSIGKSQVKRMITGSVSTFVVTHCPITTMVVKPGP